MASRRGTSMPLSVTAARPVALPLTGRSQSMAGTGRHCQMFDGAADPGLRRRPGLVRSGFSIDGSSLYGDLPAMRGSSMRYSPASAFLECPSARTSARSSFIGPVVFALVSLLVAAL